MENLGRIKYGNSWRQYTESRDVLLETKPENAAINVTRPKVSAIFILFDY